MNHSASKKVIYAALAGNFLVSLTKFIAAGLTRSAAMFSEGIHSLVDTGNQFLLLYGEHRSRRPPDDAFPFGYGKEVYFWSFVVALLIFALGAGVSIYEGFHRLTHPHPLVTPFINYGVLLFSFLFEGSTWFFALREFSKQKGRRGYLEAVHQGKNPSIFMVLFEDSAAMIGLVIAFGGVFLGQVTGDSRYDGIASLLIGLILGATAIWLAFETKGLLIGESALPEVIQDIRGIAAGFPEIEHVNEVLTLHMGPEYILVNLSVDFRDSITAERVEEIIGELVKTIKTRHPLVKRVFVEAEPRQLYARGNQVQKPRK